MSNETVPKFQDISEIKYMIDHDALGQVLVVLEKHNHPLYRWLLQRSALPITEDVYRDLAINERDIIKLVNYINNRRTGRWLTSLFLLCLGFLNFVLFVHGFYLLSHSDPYGIVLIPLACAATPFAALSIGLGVFTLRANLQGEL